MGKGTVRSVTLYAIQTLFLSKLAVEHLKFKVSQEKLKKKSFF